MAPVQYCKGYALDRARAGGVGSGVAECVSSGVTRLLSLPNTRLF